MAMSKKSNDDLHKKFSSVPSANYDCQFGIVRIEEGGVHISSKGLTSSAFVANEARENKDFDKSLVHAQSLLMKRQGSAEFVAEVDSGLIGIVKGGGMIMSMRDSQAPTMPNTLGFSAGKIVTDVERKAGVPINSIATNAFAEIEFTYMRRHPSYGRLTFVSPTLKGVGPAEQHYFSMVLKRGGELFAQQILGDKKITLGNMDVVPVKFHDAPTIYEECYPGYTKEIYGAAFAAEHDNGSTDIIIPILYQNFLTGSCGEDNYTPTPLVDIEVRGGELSTGAEGSLKSLNRPVVYVYGPDAKTLVFQSGKVLFETNNFNDFIAKSGMRESVMKGKTTGVSSQVRTVLFGKYDEIVSQEGSYIATLSQKSAITKALRDLWKEAKREDLLELTRN
ncbi:MAG: hypothetical protein KGH49_01595 [Candidatus Micrarchaeota archaeon]|nr:hypothetical protein [Candidatus Micrarchaeota archaeon]